MSSWAAGYVLDIEYTSGFYRELAPGHLNFALRVTGVRPFEMGPGATYCELACGQGFGTALLAAANPQMRFWGFDFNPAQIANARRLAAEAGLTNVTFEDYSFEQGVDLSADTLPQFDVITLHGIYSWISEENRRFIVEFLDKRLKPGGLVYVSYNAMPGWAQMAPFQRLMREHANRHPDRSDLQAEAALKFAEAMKAAGGLYFTGNPSVGPRMEKLPGMNRNYLAHEYLNGYWHPLYHLDVVREMEAARLTYACSATIAENIDAFSVPAGVHPLIASTRDRAWQETMRDYASNKQFRRDLFMRGVSHMPAAEQGRALGEMRFALAVKREAITYKFAGPIGELTGAEAIYGPIADALAQRPHSLAELSKLPALAGQPTASLLQALAVFVHAGQVQPLVAEAKGKSGDAARAFNRVVAGRIRNGEHFNFLAAPAAGSGVAASYVELIATLALFENPKATPQIAAAGGWAIMAQTGQRLVKDGKTLQGEAETMPELTAQLTTFWAEKLPIWKTLGVL